MTIIYVVVAVLGGFIGGILFEKNNSIHVAAAITAIKNDIAELKKKL